MGKEVQEQISIEKFRTLYTNPQVYLELYKKEEDKSVREFTPRSMEEIEDVLQQLNSVNQGGERLGVTGVSEDGS